MARTNKMSARLLALATFLLLVGFLLKLLYGKTEKLREDARIMETWILILLTYY